MTTASLSDRLAARKRRRIRRWWIAAGILAVLIAIGSAAWFTPVLKLKAVDVTGAQLTEPGQVRETVLGAHAGTPLPRIRLAALEQQLLEAFPKAAEIDARWSGPNSLRIAVTDRQPVLAVPEDGAWSRYDGEGKIIDSVPQAPDDLPALRLDAVSDVPTAITAAVEFMEAVPASERQHIRTMTAGSAEDLSIVYLHEDTEITIIFGTPEDAARKFEVARTLLETGAEQIDVSVPEVPVTG